MLLLLKKKGYRRTGGKLRSAAKLPPSEAIEPHLMANR
jgi:hypothetical protein